MRNAADLHVAAPLHQDASHVAVQAGGRADIAVRSHNHVADQRRGEVHNGRRVDDRNDAVDGIDFV